MKRVLNLLSVLILSVCVMPVSGCSREVQLSPLGTGAVILAFGDSITFGTGAAEGESYPAQLERMSGHRVINAGVPGEVSAAGLQRLPELLDREKPGLLLLCHGGNDLLQKLDTKRLAENLRSMIRAARDKGIPVILVAVPAPDLGLTPPGLYAEIAAEFSIPIELKSLPKILGKGSLKSDYIHPNAAGYRMMAESLNSLLRKCGVIN